MAFKLCFIGILLTGLLGISCSKFKKENANDSIVGEWEWVKTDGGIANHIHDTPASTGKKVELRLTDQSYFITTNGALSSQGTYTLVSATCIHDHRNKAVIDFSSASDPDMMVEEMNNNTLILSDEAYDGVGSLYHRKGTNGN